MLNTSIKNYKNDDPPNMSTEKLEKKLDIWLLNKLSGSKNTAKLRKTRNKENKSIRVYLSTTKTLIISRKTKFIGRVKLEEFRFMVTDS